MSILRRSHLQHFFTLSKFRLNSLVAVTTGSGYLCGSYLNDVSVPHLIYTCVGTGLCAASASAFNQIFEVDRDKLMKRTQRRPLPLGVLKTRDAYLFGIGSGIFGTLLLHSTVDDTVSLLGASNIFLYSGVYTYLKQKSELNTWMGGIVGSIPPVMGWIAAGGSIYSPHMYALGTILYLWQLPHFFALSYIHRRDYSRGGFQMVAINDESGIRSANLVHEYNVYLTLFPVICVGTGLTTEYFLVPSSMANVYLLYLSRKFIDDRTQQIARKIFYCTLWHLPLMLGSYVYFAQI